MDDIFIYTYIDNEKALLRRDHLKRYSLVVDCAVMVHRVQTQRITILNNFEIALTCFDEIQQVFLDFN